MASPHLSRFQGVLRRVITARNPTVRYRYLVFAVLLLGLVRLGIVLALPSEPFAGTIDEAGYAELVSTQDPGPTWTYAGGGSATSLWASSRALLIPAAVLQDIFGGDAIIALRMVSVFYSTLSGLLLIALIYLARREASGAAPLEGPALLSWQIFGLAIFLLLPSHALWGLLGLREAAAEFWALAAVVSAASMRYLVSNRSSRLMFALATALCLSIAYLSRSYAAAALTLALICTATWLATSRRSLGILLMGSTLSGAVLGIVLLRSAPVDTASQDASAAVGTASEVIKTLNPGTYVGKATPQRARSTVGAESAIPVDRCTQVVSVQLLWWCELTRLPGAATTVLFRPLAPFDAGGTNWRTLAAFENWLWIGLAALTVVALVRRRSALMLVVTVSMIYVLAYIVGMALLEGNLGTAFRHKSGILWALCAIMLVTGRPRSRRVS